MSKTFLTAEWRKLLMINYKADKKLVEGLIPAGTEIDLYTGECYISLVGFIFLNTRVKGFAIPFHVNFEEVNLRFYVKRIDGEDVKRGVVFIKEIVPKRLIAFAANNIYNENYEAMPMKHEWNINSKEISVKYFWKKGRWNSISASGVSKLLQMKQGSEEEFIAEHYWGYSGGENLPTVEYEVIHPPWEIYNVSEYDIDVDFENVYGKEYTFLNTERPASVFLAEGSAIRVMEGKKIV